MQAEEQLSYRIRRFAERDLPRVMDINARCLPENYSSSFFLELYKAYPKTFVVAEFENQVIGYIMCRVETGFSELSRLRPAKKGHVVSVAVLGEHRRRGVGTALMLEAVRGMTAYGCGETYLEVRESNHSAIRLYEKLNFKTVRKIAGYYVDGEAAYLMARRLPFTREWDLLSQYRGSKFVIVS